MRDWIFINEHLVDKSHDCCLDGVDGKLPTVLVVAIERSNLGKTRLESLLETPFDAGGFGLRLALSNRCQNDEQEFSGLCERVDAHVFKENGHWRGKVLQVSGGKYAVHNVSCEP